jgi:hypothetical protein
MKTITIQGRTFEYIIFTNLVSTGGVLDYKRIYSTEFYQGTKQITKRSPIAFWNKITETILNLVFKVDFNIEDATITKAELREKLEDKLAVIERAEEIAKGELI